MSPLTNLQLQSGEAMALCREIQPRSLKVNTLLKSFPLSRVRGSSDRPVAAFARLLHLSLFVALRAYSVRDLSRHDNEVCPSGG